MKIIIRLASAALLMASLSACSLMAPNYNTSFDNVETLRAAKLESVSVGPVTKSETGPDVENLTIRGSKLRSPNGSYTAYLQNAIRQELDDARLLDPKSQLELSGVLIRNEIDGSGTSKGFAEIEARFVIKKGGAVRFDKVKKARHEWESSFMGSTAIPRAQQNYPLVVEKLLTALYADKDFLNALKTK